MAAFHFVESMSSEVLEGVASSKPDPPTTGEEDDKGAVEGVNMLLHNTVTDDSESVSVKQDKQDLAASVRGRDMDVAGQGENGGAVGMGDGRITSTSVSMIREVSCVSPQTI